jgi:hypothetical protein
MGAGGNQGPKKPQGKAIPSLNSLKFETDVYKYAGEKSPGTDRIWITADGDPIALIFCPGACPSDFPDEACSVDDLREYMVKRLKVKDPRARIVDFRVIQSNAGSAAWVIFKTPQGRGWTYTGSLAFPFKEFGFTIKAACKEHGMTGIREALVAFMQPRAGEMPPEGPGLSPTWNSDNERFDTDFPQHPLSRLRRILKRIAESVEIDDATLQLPRVPLPKDRVM